MKLRNKKSVIVTSDEGKPQKKLLPSFAKLLYYSVLLFLLFYALKYSYDSFIYIKAKGRVYTETFLISPPESGVIEKIYKKPYDIVLKDDPLFTIKYKIKDLSSKTGLDLIKVENDIKSQKTELENLIKKESFLKDILNNRYSSYIKDSPFTLKINNLKRDIRTKKNRIYKLEKIIQKQNKESFLIGRMRILESKTIETEDDKLSDLKIDLEFEKEELKSLYKILNEIKSFNKNYINDEIISNAIAIKRINENLGYLLKTKSELLNLKNKNYLSKTFFSPFKGKVKAVLRYNGENVNEDDSIIELIKNKSNTKIKAFFSLKEFKNISLSKKVEILFPDNKKSEGIISQFYSTSSQKETELTKDYNLIDTGIVAEIIPLDEDENNIWKKYNKLDVEVRFLK